MVLQCFYNLLLFFFKYPFEFIARAQ